MQSSGETERDGTLWDDAGVDEFGGDWIPKYLAFVARFIADEPRA